MLSATLSYHRSTWKNIRMNVEKYSDESELSIIFHTPTARFKPELVYGCTIMLQDILNASAGLQSKKEEERIENAT